MKATLFLTTACNLRCDYCYVSRQNLTMSEKMLAKAVDFVFRTAGPRDRIDFGLFGGEPLLDWPLVQKAVALIEQQALESNHTLRISLVTNGTLLNREILSYLRRNNVILQVSCDGAPHVQDRHRRFRNGKGSSRRVSANLSAALNILPAVVVNMVYGPDTYAFLPESIEYLVSLGLKQLVLNPDYAAPWCDGDMEGLKETYDRIADIYLAYYARESPVFISLIDEKIAVMLRGGYGPFERCRMGVEEFAFSPQGFIFPCERLVGSGAENRHSIGHLCRPGLLNRSGCRAGGNTCTSSPCTSCSLAGYCMNWCGCSNFFGSGDYTRPSPFICASERFSIQAAHNVMKRVEDRGQLIFVNHYAGFPMMNSSFLNQPT